MAAVDGILWQKTNKAITLTLDRPKILNPLTTDICRSVVTGLLDWRKSYSNVNCFIVKGNGKAFCAGGDIKSLYKSLIATDATNIGTGKSGSFEGDFFRSEYELNYLLNVSRIPQVSILDGIVMGGGVGLSYFGEFRIATENSLWAMPECAIGIFPDVGSCSWLPKLNSYTDKNKRINVPGLGLYLALTGQRLYAVDLINMGIATHFIHSSKLLALEDKIIEDVSNNDKNDTRGIISDVLKSFSEEGSIGPDEGKSIFKDLDKIAFNFGNIESIESLMASLEGGLSILSESDLNGNTAAGETKEWTKNTLKILKKQSPTSLKVTHQLFKNSANIYKHDLKKCLTVEYGLMMRLLRGADFKEGVRAAVIDKDNTPLWTPGTVGGVTDENVQRYFEPLGELDLDLNRLDE
eukprot:CAMPEP_0119054206 /NCGR_PEP_ID=MMETSP1177-20130426/74915_1 /TAXON_ID=2985 /ORGANISM="Ochromonas sp, Strain CCMP1899" /LENGTH=407 /DNA_ID=CAMNT_0007034367 /DNA_START=8 /DNA_END=1231 /DNA_ORIENTATION=+